MSLFNSDNEEIVTIDPNKDWLTELVGEGKPYADEKALARATAEKEAHIRKVEREAQELREAIRSQRSLEELVDKLTTSQTPSQSSPQEPPQRDDPEFKSEDLEKLIEQRLAEREAKNTRESNINAARAKLQEVYKDRTQTVLNQKMQELGVGAKFLEDVAATNPKAFFKLMGLDDVRQEQREVDPPRSSLQTPFAPSTGEKRWSHYQKLQQTMKPEEYWSAEVQNEIHKQALRQGAAFYD